MTSGILVADVARSEQRFDEPHTEVGRGRGAEGGAARGRDPPHDRQVLRVTTTTLKEGGP